MKTLLKLFVICHLPFAIGLAAFAQGSLTPPGPPAPTMKSADQIEPRTIVNAANTPGNSFNLFIISQPGSYYLTTNLVGVSDKNGISIGANNVTLDLNGFALLGVPGNGTGVDIPHMQTNVTVRNGSVSGWGGYGACNGSGASASVVFERLNVSACGDNGIYNLGAGCVVRDCNSQYNTFDGIFCGDGVVSGCTANNNGLGGIDADDSPVSGCTANNNGIGIEAYLSVVSDCTANNNGCGIDIQEGTVSGCFAGNNGVGIEVDADSSDVIGNNCIGNNAANSSSGAGILIEASDNLVENNRVAASGYAGILVNNSKIKNVIIKNSVSGNGTNNYVVPAGNDLGPVGAAATATSPWANISH